MATKSAKPNVSDPETQPRAHVFKAFGSPIAMARACEGCGKPLFKKTVHFIVDFIDAKFTHERPKGEMGSGIGGGRCYINGQKWYRDKLRACVNLCKPCAKRAADVLDRAINQLES